MSEGTVVSVNLSQRKGTKKSGVGEAILKKGFGMVGDAHAGGWRRQVSLLSLESIRRFNPNVEPGEFAENITIRGIDLNGIKVGSKIQVGESILQVTQIGKECHRSCEIKRLLGECIMPREGIFAKVVKGGRVKVGDVVRCLDG